ncbi:MAG: glycine--tRNA ligase subunit beta [Gammaproteobacteria bacterium]|nr:glycine--tRNA ligase subunit beta [Gammaproteobacteria bacterium]
MNTRSLLVEIGTEELPPPQLQALGEAFAAALAGAFERDGFRFAQTTPFATPRRLAVHIAELPERGPGRVTERKGPSLDRCYDEHKQPTPAALGFARSCGVALEDLQVSDDNRLCLRRRETGAAVQELLEAHIAAALQALPAGRRMRWGAAAHEFIRPVRWVLALYGGEAAPVRVLGVRAGAVTHGHRQHCPQPLPVRDADAWEDTLETEGRVIASFAKRRRRIAAQVERAAEGRALVGDALLDEVTAMTEWPAAIAARFNPSFLSLPAEVIIEVLEHDQKFFPTADAGGALLPDFVAVANIESAAPENIRRGYERVVAPRLSDAAFFFAQDQKRTLESRLPELGGILFHRKLGSLADKTRRLEQLVGQLAEHLAEQLNTPAEDAVRAAHLCKADLATDMVREYPALEGVIGRYYALADGESGAVAAAISGHRLPRRAGGALAPTAAGALLALADRLDTLAGIVGAGELPSGSKDPYGLRRAGAAVVRIVLEKQLDLDLGDWIARAAGAYGELPDPDGIARLPGYLLDRIRGHYLERGCAADEIAAAMAVRPLQLLDLDARLAAVRHFKALPQTGSLTLANKRIRNILKKDGAADAPAAAEDAPAANAATAANGGAGDDAESALQRAFRDRRRRVNDLAGRRDYLGALNTLVELREPIDRFFDEVLVMSEDENERRSRIGLLRDIHSLFTCIADFSKLDAKPGAEAA